MVGGLIIGNQLHGIAHAVEVLLLTYYYIAGVNLGKDLDLSR